MSLDWLPITLPGLFVINTPSDIGVNATELELSRSADLGLRVSIRTIGRPIPAPVSVPGTENKGLEVQLRTQDDQPGVLQGYRRLQTVTKSDGEAETSHVSGSAVSVRVTLRAGSAATIVDWLTNVPEGIVWTQFTEWREQHAHERTRDGVTIRDTSDRETSRLDHIDLDLSLARLARVRFGTVPPESAEGVDCPGFLEFFPGSDGLADEQLRRSVRRALEFLFGRGFGVLGTSELDAGGAPLSCVVCSAYVPGGSGGGLRPAMLHENQANGLDESLIATFVRRYVELEPLYELNQAVWLSLHARGAALEMAAGYVGAAYELLPRGYYRQLANEPRSRVLPKGEWKAIARALASAIDTLEQQESWKGFSDGLATIRTSINGLNNVSGSRLNLLFLSDLGLRFGSTERRALQARNDAAHANVDATSNFKGFRALRGLQTLFARCVFGILGVKVRYFDYSTNGFPIRELTEEQGGAPATS